MTIQDTGSVFARTTIAALAISIFCAPATDAQVTCGVTGPDVVVGDFMSPSNYASDAGIEAFALGMIFCNMGDAGLSFIGNTNQHPVAAQNLYRLKTVNGTARLEQIGLGWAFHPSSTSEQSLCCANCQPLGAQQLGVRCSSADTSSAVGTQTKLGPRTQVNPSTGQFAFPISAPAPTGSTSRRLQARISDIDPTQSGGGQHIAELVVISPGDALAGNAHNNASVRNVTISGSGSTWNMGQTGATQRGVAAIELWQDSDPQVVQTIIDVPGDGRFILASRAFDLGRGHWRYEYALFNLNSELAARSFTIPLPNGAAPTALGFHDVDYHSGDGIGGVNVDGTDWPSAISGSSIGWSTDPFATNPNANAIRWGTLYNFRFEVDVPPSQGQVDIGLFKSVGSVPGAAVIPTPAPLCPADVNASGGIDVDDLLAVINGWGPCANPNDCPADVAPAGGNDLVNVDDLLTVINAWGPCP